MADQEARPYSHRALPSQSHRVSSALTLHASCVRAISPHPCCITMRERELLCTGTLENKLNARPLPDAFDSSDGMCDRAASLDVARGRRSCDCQQAHVCSPRAACVAVTACRYTHLKLQLCSSRAHSAATTPQSPTASTTTTSGKLSCASRPTRQTRFILRSS